MPMIDYQVLKKPTQMLIKKTQIQYLDQHYNSSTIDQMTKFYFGLYKLHGLWSLNP
jgi:hypothetical protein